MILAVSLVGIGSSIFVQKHLGSPLGSGGKKGIKPVYLTGSEIQEVHWSASGSGYREAVRSILYHLVTSSWFGNLGVI
jgi:hypothetical protein